MNARRIEKKAWPKLFTEVAKGNKKFDLRLGDFKCKKGDVLVLREWDPKVKKYTGRKIEKRITFVIRTDNTKFWTKKEIEGYGFQIMSLHDL